MEEQDVGVGKLTTCLPAHPRINFLNEGGIEQFDSLGRYEFLNLLFGIVGHLPIRLFIHWFEAYLDASVSLVELYLTGAIPRVFLYLHEKSVTVQPDKLNWRQVDSDLKVLHLLHKDKMTQ